MRKTASTNFYRDIIHPYFEIKTCSSDNHAFKEHYHEELTIGLIDTGIGMVNYNGKTYKVAPKCAIIIPSNVIHYCNAINKIDWTYRMLYINNDWFNSLFMKKISDLKPSIQCINLINYFEINNMFEALQESSSKLDKENLLIKVLDNLLNFGNLSNNQINEYKKINKHISKIYDYINENFLKEITLDDLVYIGKISKCYVIKLFELTYGTSPHKYQTMLKVNFAKNALRNGKCISEVALISGFCDQSHFTKAFKKYIGVTPLSFSCYK